MAMYAAQDATLGDLKGQGYAFLKRTFRGKEFRGVFFVSDEEDVETLEHLQEEDEVSFSGIVYKKMKSGRVTKKVQTVDVDVKQLVSVRAGQRADFHVVSD